jgi:TatA/E family protein of Tat protein translocase
MFGIGSTELIIFLVIVLIIFGPKNLPRLAQALGKSVRELKNGLSGVSDELKDSMREDWRANKPEVRQNTQNPQNPGQSDAQPVQRDSEDKPKEV